MKKITFLLVFLLTAVSGSYGQCLDATSATPLYPTATYTPAVCDGVTLNSITTAGYASEYSNVNVTLGETYTFTSSVATDFITIGSADGSTAIVWGENATLTWIADVTDVVRFYTHLDNACGAEDVNRVRGIICGTPPTCPKPLNVSVTSITTTTADFTWDAGGSETEWEVAVLPNGDPAPDAATSGINVSGTSAYSAASLIDSSAYQFYVRASCGGGDYSTWTAATNFATSCVAITTFTENFDAAVAFPTCWSKVGTLGLANVQASAGAVSAPNVLYIYSSTGTNQAVVAMPAVSNAGSGTHRLKFKARANFTVGGVLEVGYLTNSSDASSFVSLQSFTTTSTSTFDSFTAFLGTEPGTNEVLAFRNLGTPANSILLDDVSWDLIPSCSEPNNLSASNITDAAATVSWSESITVPSNGYEYYISEDVTAPDAGTTPTGTVGAGVLTYNFTSLIANTTYNVWVRSACSGGTSEWSSVVTFKTNCASLTSFFENFDAALTIPDCWSKVGTLGTSNVQTSDVAPSAPNVLYIYGTSATNQAVMAMPAVSNAGAGTHQLRFKAKANFTVGGVIEVGYLTNSSDATSFVSLQSFTTTSTSAFDTFAANLGTDPGANQVLAFRHSGVPANSVLIDDVSWDVIPTCVEPTTLVASDVTATTAVVSWTESTSVPANGYEYFVSTSNTAPTATEVATGSVAAGITMVDLANLSPATAYYVWVRSVCSTTDSSSWSNVVTFSTSCVVVVPVYSQDFATFPPACWTGSNAGDETTGPTGTANEIWVADGFLNVGSTEAIKVNLYSTNRTGWMISPTADLSLGNYSVSFDYAVTTWNQTTSSQMGSDDTVKLLMSEDDGATWTVLTIFDAASAVPNTSQTFALNLTSVSPSVKFAFVANDGTVNDLEDYDFFIDNFKIDVTLANTTFDNANFVYYPNPVKDVLNLSYTNNISNVTVFNLLGQQMSSKTFNANQSKVDMSNLAAGTYLVKVTADNQVKTIKVIKE